MTGSRPDMKLVHNQNLVPGSGTFSVSYCVEILRDLLFTQLRGYLPNIFSTGLLVSSNCLNFLNK